jgi:hypothetical protein
VAYSAVVEVEISYDKMLIVEKLFTAALHLKHFARGVES